MTRLFAALVICACSTTPEPCSESDAVLAAKVAECKLEVERVCKGIPDAECPVVAECDAWVDSRCGISK